MATNDPGISLQGTELRPRQPMPDWLTPYLPDIAHSRLFSGIDQDETRAILGCLAPERRRFDRDEYVLRVGDEVSSVPIILEGSVSVVREDWWGNRNIQSRVGAGDTFAVAYALTPGARIGVSVVADRPTLVVELGVARMLRTCSYACPYHMRLLQNLVGTIAQKNLQVNAKLSYLSQRTTRAKLLAYLSATSQQAGSPSFDIPYNRQQLADYLSVNRSAMSSELSRMAEEGLISFRRNHFRLLKPIEV